MVFTQERKNEIFGIFIIVFALLLGISLFFNTAGIVGVIIKVFFMILAGKGAYIFPVLFLFLGISVIRSRSVKFSPRLAGLIIVICTVLTFLHVFYIPQGLEFTAAIEQQGGGLIGCTFAYFFRNFLGQTGTYVILSAILLIGLLLLFDILLISLFSTFKKRINKLITKVTSWFKRINEKIRRIFPFSRNESANEGIDQFTAAEDDLDDPFLEELALLEDLPFEVEAAATDEVCIKADLDEKLESNNELLKKNKENSSKASKQKKKSVYKLPSLRLLRGGQQKKNKQQQSDNSELLENTLQSFGVQAKVVSVSHGPTITRYELQPAPGVKVSKIVNLADDIALSMAATDVRIVAPIPGKSAVGVEVPNRGSTMVKLKDILQSNAFQNAKSRLTLALGVGIAGEPVIADLKSMPHLLVAGATGSGKSVCINTMILSILYKAKPDEIKFLLIDPKKVELTAYKKLPHLLAPVVTNPKKASAVLKMVVQEMENRYELFASSGTRGIDSYNKLMKKRKDAYNRAMEEDGEVEDSLKDHNTLPFIVVIIDELADLMMVAASDVEDAICRLAQMARAAGIHLIIATQRPSVDVITGLIKANIPSRIAFAVSSQVDSRTILDSAGAEKLLGKGDLLFAPVGSNKPKRIQGAFVSTEEVLQVMEVLAKQEEPEYASAIQKLENGELVINQEQERDELYEDAVRIVVSSSASISMLQRRLHIGYTRAARMIDMMETDGIVGPYVGSKAREVLITENEVESILNRTENSKE